MERRAWLVTVLVLAAGCAAEFSEVKHSGSSGNLAISYCGSTGASAGSVIAAMDNPGSVDNGPLPAERELTICLVAENRGSKDARLDRSHAHLQCPREKQEWLPDRDPEVLTIAPGASQKLHITFRYAPVQRDEQVSLLLDDLHLAITLRRN